MTNPKLSIIIPVYNVAPYIRQCLDSILSQDFVDYEVLCIDDGSTDTCPDIINEYIQSHSNFKLINQPNQGPGAARNKGIELAVGNYIMFIDPDDFYDNPTVFTKMVSTIETSGCQIVGGRHREIIFQDGQEINNFLSLDVYPNSTGVNLYSQYQATTYFWRYIYKRELLITNNIRFPLWRRYQDPPFFIRAMATAKKFYAIDDCVYCFRRRHKKVDFLKNHCSILNEMLHARLDAAIIADKFHLQHTLFRVVKRGIDHVATTEVYAEVKTPFIALLQFARNTPTLDPLRKFAIAVKLFKKESLGSRIKWVLKFLSNHI